MEHTGVAKPYDARVLMVPVVVDDAAWTAYVFADSCQVRLDKGTLAGTLTFVSEPGQYKVVQGLTGPQKAFVKRVGEAFRSGAAMAQFRPTCTPDNYEAILVRGAYALRVEDLSELQDPEPSSEEEGGCLLHKYRIHAATCTSVVNDGFVLYVKGRLPQPYFAPNVPTMQFLFSVEEPLGGHPAELPYAHYFSYDNAGLDCVCNGVFDPHATPGPIQSCSMAVFGHSVGPSTPEPSGSTPEPSGAFTLPSLPGPPV